VNGAQGAFRHGAKKHEITPAQNSRRNFTTKTNPLVSYVGLEKVLNEHEPLLCQVFEETVEEIMRTASK
jgi:hypothetical protein